jgi:aspartyl-tRNA synthetase
VRAGAYTPPPAPHVLWVTEFPLFTRADADKAALAGGRWASTHHPFTAPLAEHAQALLGCAADGDARALAALKGQHFDLVLDGVELGGGSVRVHDAAMQEHVFRRVLELGDAETAGFAHLLHALASGAPPHAGLALGLDRMLALLAGAQSIRDVVAFPKTGAGTDPLFRSPARVPDAVLADVHLRPLVEGGGVGEEE